MKSNLTTKVPLCASQRADTKEERLHRERTSRWQPE